MTEAERGARLEELLGELDEDGRFVSVVVRNTFRAAGVATFDLAASKRIALGRGHSVTLRVEAFNVFNQDQFYGPATVDGNISSPTFGQIVAAAPPRLMQIGMKVMF